MIKILGVIVGTEREMATEISSEVASLARKQARDYMVDVEAANTRAQTFKEEARKWRYKAKNLEEENEALRFAQHELWAAIGLATLDLKKGNARQALNALESPCKTRR